MRRLMKTFRRQDVSLDETSFVGSFQSFLKRTRVDYEF